ncbi:hypothetical protein HYU95_04755 [Candidatus Daviesbacteria bacterium]|nr:hypothetical protein [Candidatus Daviesbacteria bacterium]
MGSLKKLLISGLFALLVFPSVAFAGDEFKVDSKVELLDGSRFEAKIDGDEVEFRDEFASGEETRFRSDGEEFKVEGTINDISDDSFTVGFFNVMVDPTMVEDFEQDGDLMVGAEAEVEGMVIDGVNFAEEIKVEEADEEVEMED